MGRAEAKPIATCIGIDGYRFAPPILRGGPHDLLYSSGYDPGIRGNIDQLPDRLPFGALGKGANNRVSQ